MPLEPVKTGDSVKVIGFRPLSRAPNAFITPLTWGLRPRLYAYACYRRLRKSFDFDIFVQSRCTEEPAKALIIFVSAFSI